MSWETFNFILSRIRHVLEKDTINEEVILPEFRLAICFNRLSKDYYYTGLRVSTVCTICMEVTRGILESMWVDCVGRHMQEVKKILRRC